ncbi:MAG: YraN family protein [Armatimonadetes bacterium]|nr:YraN family protein [Anaerolineae bacterium]
MTQPSSSPTQSIGQKGEALAASYLQAQGWAILATNWRCTRGELDIIAQHGAMLVFVEVRTRRAENTEAAFASITPTKRKRLMAAIYDYLAQQDLGDTDWRVDAIAVALRRHAAPLIDHAEDALGW